MNRQAEHDIRRKTKVLQAGTESGNISHTCRKYGVHGELVFWHNFNCIRSLVIE